MVGKVEVQVAGSMKPDETDMSFSWRNCKHLDVRRKKGLK